MSTARSWGHLDGIDSCHAVGWAYRPGGACAVEIIAEDGRTLARGLTDISRPDVEAAGLVPANKPCGFRIPLPPTADKDIMLRARLADGRLLLGAAMLTGTAARGFLEEVTAGVVRGWAVGFGGETVRVTLLFDDRPVATVPADQLRPDLCAAGIGDGQHGFTVALPRVLAQAGGVVSVVAEGGDAPLEGCPRLLPPMPIGAISTSEAGPAFLERMFAEVEAAALTSGPAQVAALARLAVLVMDGGDAVCEPPLGVFFDARYGLLVRLRALGQTAAANAVEIALLISLTKAGSAAAVRLEPLCALTLRTRHGAEVLSQWLDGLPDDQRASVAAGRLRLRTAALSGRDPRPALTALLDAPAKILLEEADALVALGQSETAASLYGAAVKKIRELKEKVPELHRCSPS